MLRVCGTGRVRIGDPFPCSTVFLADERQAEALSEPRLRERIAAALGSSARAVAWVGGDGAVTVLPYDEQARVTRRVELATGLTIEPGSIVEAGNPRLTIHGAGDQPDVTVGIEGESAGALGYRSTAGVDAWIRYFHPRTGSLGAIDALRFRLFPLAETRVDVRFDPANPHGPARSRATPASATTRASTFRTRWGAAVELTALPPHSSYVWAYDPASGESYMTLDGVWGWSVAGGGQLDAIELLPGSSGAEYVKGAAAFVVRFVAGAPAFAPDFDAAVAVQSTQDSPFPLTASAPGVRQPVTTAWLYVEPAPGSQAGADAGGAGYFSQPERAVMFTPAGGDQFLSAYDLRAADLPPGATSPLARSGSFPAVPYAGLEASGPPLDVVRRFEAEVLTPARTEAIDRLQAPVTGPRGVGSGDVGAVGATGPSVITPQGLLSTFSAEGDEWRSLVLAQADLGAQRLQYTNVEGKLREALLATQLFLVVSDAGKLLEHCSTTYCVTAESLDLARKLKQVPDAALAQAHGLVGIVYYSAGALDAALAQVLSAPNQAYAPDIRRYAELAELSIAGWTFDLASWRWATGDQSTMLVIDFADGDFESLVADRSRWTLPDEFNADSAAAQKQLTAMIADARRLTEPDLKPFVDTVLATGDAAWHGVLYLNVPVPAAAFPPEIEALAAGLGTADLYAHHLGVTISSFGVSGGRIALADSALFGLILHEDPADLPFKGDAYDFKVLSLKVLFANSTIAAFSSQVELLVGRLFAELAQLSDYGAHGPNNIVLDGTLQNGAFRFASSTSHHFTIASQVVEFVTVDRAQFVTLPAQSTEHHVAARFLLEGSMGFKRLADFDLFGYGSSEGQGDSGRLAFSNMLVTMEFDPQDPGSTRKLAFVAGQMNLDPVRSSARAGSLPRRFPLQVAAMRDATTTAAGAQSAKPAKPADLGFIPVESPLTPGDLGSTWFGLELALSFGDPGGLASTLGFTGALLASWAPSEKGYDVAVGLRLPGSGGGRKSLTIMGPLNLSIGRLTFLYDTATSGYLLTLQNIALSFLGLTFPPGGKTNAVLFGDPDPQGANPALGWYAAYKKDEEKKKDSDQAQELPWPA